MASYTLYSANSYQGRKLRLYCTSTINIAENTSTINWTLYSEGGTSSYYTTGPTTVVINGVQVYYKEQVGYSKKVFPASKGSVSGSITVPHNSDGSKSINVSLSTAIYVSQVTTNSGTWTLDNIPRQATITSATDFNDTQNPSFTFDNPANASLSCWLEPNPNGPHLCERTLSGSSGTYTWTLTDAERNQLRQSCTGKTCTIRIGLYSTIGGNTFASYVDKTFTIIDANPTFDVAYLDSNSTTTGITDNNQLIIQNQSTLQINITNATALKYATLSQVSVNINGVVTTQSISSSSLTLNIGTIDVASNLSVPVTLTDSRGNSTTINLSIQVLSWSLPTAIISLQRLNNYYDTTNLTVDADYSSLDNKNTINIQYQIKKVSDSTYGSLATIQDNVQTQFTADNTFEWNVKVILTDRLGTTSYVLTLPKGVSIIYFDRLLNSVGINCFPSKQESLALNGDDILELISGKVLYSDATGTTGDITLSDDASNYAYIEIFYKKETFNSVKVPNPDGQNVVLDLHYYYDTVSTYQVVQKSITISGTSITVNTDQCLYTNFKNNSYPTLGPENNIKITKVVGYKY